MKLFFATEVRIPSYNEIMTQVGVRDRLYSYFELRDCSPEDTDCLMMTGRNVFKMNSSNKKRRDTNRRLALAKRVQAYEVETCE